MTLADVTRAGIALLGASALWLVVSSDEPASAWVPVRLVIATDGSVQAIDSIPPVRALVLGRRRDLLRLARAPLVLRRTVAADARDSVTFTLRATEFDMPAGIDARVRDVQPQRVTLALAPR